MVDIPTLQPGMAPRPAASGPIGVATVRTSNPGAGMPMPTPEQQYHMQQMYGAMPMPGGMPSGLVPVPVGGG